MEPKPKQYLVSDRIRGQTRGEEEEEEEEEEAARGGGQRGRGKHGTDGVMVEGVGIMRGRHTGRANG